MTGDEPKVKQYLIAAVDVPTFLAFKKHYEQFMILNNAGVFELEHGKATINKHEGHIQSVHVDRRTYQFQAV